jgi:hypothetical protein
MLPTSQNLNNMQSSNWFAHIPGFDELTFKIKKFSIPAVTAGVTSIGNITSFVLEESGDHITYEELTFDFLVDENLLNYRKLYKWMRENTRVGIADTTSIFIHATDNNKMFQGVELEFLEAFPIELGELEMESDGDVPEVTCTITFKFTAFDFVDETERDQ